MPMLDQKVHLETFSCPQPSQNRISPQLLPHFFLLSQELKFSLQPPQQQLAVHRAWHSARAVLALLLWLQFGREKLPASHRRNCPAPPFRALSFENQSTFELQKHIPTQQAYFQQNYLPAVTDIKAGLRYIELLKMKLVQVSVHGFRILVLNRFADLDLGSQVSSDRTAQCKFQCFLPPVYPFFAFLSS